VYNQGLGGGFLEYRGFRGVNPGFTHFEGFRGYLGQGSYSRVPHVIRQSTMQNNIIIIHNIILSIISISIQGGAI
jgi:hypothetical protein